MAENKLEKGEYVIGIAVILAALLLSLTLFVGVGNIEKAIGKIGAGTAGTQGTAGTAGTTGPAAPQVVVDLGKAQYQGNPNGDVIMVEYSDFQCPYCGRVVPTINQLVANYNGLKFTFKQFPLSIHQYAEKAAEASLCAGAQGKFWELHAKMYENQGALSVSDLKADAAALGLDTASFNSCLDSGSMANEVSAENSEGAAMGISGTPGFLVYSKNGTGAALAGKLDTAASQLKALGATATVVDVQGAGKGIVFAGALPYANFQQVMAAFE